MIRLFKPEIAFESIEGPIKEILESGQLTQGSFLQKFERYVGDYIGVKHAIATTSATTGLHLGLIAMGVKQHDEVLVSDFTFPATGNVICQIGAVPVLVDCEPNSFEINLEDLKKKITPQSKAILVVDPFGQPVNFEEIKKIAEDHNLFVLEDAACAIGAKRNGVYCGAWADMGVFSFHPRKLITTGEGGMITTNNDELANYARTLFSHGSVSSPNGRVFIHNGYNYRMPEISAVVGLEQMQKIDTTLNNRRKMAKQYFDLLSNSKDLIIPLSSSIEDCTFQSFVVLLRTGINRGKIIEFMKSKNIEVTIGTYSMHAEPAFERFGYKPGDLKHSYIASTQSLTLPLHGFLKKNDLEYIVSSLTEAINLCAPGRNT